MGSGKEYGNETLGFSRGELPSFSSPASLRPASTLAQASEPPVPSLTPTHHLPLSFFTFLLSFMTGLKAHLKSHTPLPVKGELRMICQPSGNFFRKRKRTAVGPSALWSWNTRSGMSTLFSYSTTNSEGWLVRVGQNFSYSCSCSL